MTPRNDFVPVGKHVEASRQLELSFIDQQDLIYEMKQTSKELDENPHVPPVFKSVKLGRIALLNSAGERKGTDKLWLQYSQMEDGRKNAIIDFIDDDRLHQMRLSQKTGRWDLFQNDHPDPVKDFSSEGLVTILRNKLRQPEALESLLDCAGFDPITIPELLASHLYKYSPHRRKKLIYRSSDVTMAVHENDSGASASHLASTSTELDILDYNGRQIHALRTRAPYNVSNTTITKEYSYSAKTNSAHFIKTQGEVKVASKDGYNFKELDPYARNDQSVNDPLFGLHRGLASIRKNYGLDQEAAA